MQVFDDIQQGSPEWFEIRSGIPTASMFSVVSQKQGPRGGKPKGRTTYMYKLAGEIITGRPMDNYTNHHMERGKEQEPEARSLYEFERGVRTQQIGFIKNGSCGASPDSLVGASGLLEIKSALPHIQIERLLTGKLPSEHVAQVQGQLMVSERRWCDFISYCPGMPPLIVRVNRDDEYIANLRVDIDAFVDELNRLVKTIKEM